MGRDAVLACTQDRVHPVDAVDRRAAAAWLAFVARGRRVIEIKTARALQQVASRGGHIAQLRRSAGEDCACQQGIARLYLRGEARPVLGTSGPMRKPPS